MTDLDKFETDDERLNDKQILSNPNISQARKAEFLKYREFVLYYRSLDSIGKVSLSDLQAKAKELGLPIPTAQDLGLFL